MNILSHRVTINMPGKKTLFSLFIIIHTFSAFSQSVEINYKNESLNHILIDLRDRYDLLISFNDKELSQYKLTVNQTFVSPSKALDYLVSGFPVTYEINNDVFVFYSPAINNKPEKYQLSGRVVDARNTEALPFSGILINNSGQMSDMKGNFAFSSASDSIFKIKISYVGYYILDTVVGPGSGKVFKLTPSVVSLQEIIVKGATIEQNIQTGNAPGVIKINHKVAYLLPGNGDNSVFNLLRLQPGILAAGEQSSDLLIWGSYEGHSQILFDGFTLYGMKNFHDNISTINPYMTKDIQVYKGGFGAEYGERVGGIVDITGIDGNKSSFTGQFTVNNLTLNGMISIPVAQKSAISLAYRQTYRKLYNAEESSISDRTKGRGNSGADYYVYPDYTFRDLNLKYSGNGKNNNYFISLYGGGDQFGYDFNNERQESTISARYNEENFQTGASLFYNHIWKNNISSNLHFRYSMLKNEVNRFREVEKNIGNQTIFSLNENYRTEIREAGVESNHRIHLYENQILETGIGLTTYTTRLKEDTAGIVTSERDATLLLPFIYIQDNITILNNLMIRPGLRTNYHTLSGKIYLQPRIAFSYKINEIIKFTGSWGLYDQYVAKNMIVDELGNVRFAWYVSNNKDIPVLKARNTVAGITLFRNNFTLAIEGYIKSVSNITRYIPEDSEPALYEGKSKTKGIDFFVKKEFSRYTVWASYTLSKTLEYFPYFTDGEYRPALHDQRHEVKMAGIARLGAFNISANFVYGSGFPDPLTIEEAEYNNPYSRLDAAIIYKLSKRKLHVDIGISVLNILHKENVKYTNFTYVPSDETSTLSIYSESVPFTPTLFLNVHFN